MTKTNPQEEILHITNEFQYNHQDPMKSSWTWSFDIRRGDVEKFIKMVTLRRNGIDLAWCDKCIMEPFYPDEAEMGEFCEYDYDPKKHMITFWEKVQTTPYFEEELKYGEPTQRILISENDLNLLIDELMSKYYDNK